MPASSSADEGASVRHLDRAMPRLTSLVDGIGSAIYGTDGGEAVLRLAGRLLSLARSHVGTLERLPPFRWFRRAPRIHGHVARMVDRILAKTFNAADLAAARDAAATTARELTAHHLGRAGWLADRARLALEVARAPLRALVSLPT